MKIATFEEKNQTSSLLLCSNQSDSIPRKRSLNTMLQRAHLLIDNIYRDSKDFEHKQHMIG